MKWIISSFQRLLPRNHFARGVSVLVSGTVGAQIAMMLAAPVLTRIYSPQQFGFLALFAALLSVAATGATLRYETAIPLPDKDDDAIALLALSLLMVIVVSIISILPVILYRKEIAKLLNAPGFADDLYLLPLGILLMGAYNALNYWATRMKAFILVARTRVSRSIAAILIQIAGAPLGTIALLLGQIVSQASGSISLANHLWKEQRNLIATIRRSDLAAVAREYKKFAIFAWPGSLLNAVSSQLPAILFATLFSTSVAGIYLLTNRVIAMPMQLLGEAIANVFFSGAAKAHREKRLDSIVARIHDRLAHIAMPPTLVLLLAGPDIFQQVFGQEWRQAGVFAQWLAPCFYLTFLSSPLSAVFNVVDRLGISLFFHFSQFAIHLMAIIVGAWIGDPLVAVALLALGGGCYQAVKLAWIVRVSGNGWLDVCRPTVVAFAWGAVLLSPVILATWLNIDKQMLLLAFVAAGLLVAARYAYLMKEIWQ